MGLRLSVFKNTLALSVPNVLNPFISFILVLVISRYMGVKGLGQCTSRPLLHVDFQYTRSPGSRRSSRERGGQKAR